MEFWAVGHSADAVAVVDARSGKAWTYESLRRDVDGLVNALPRLRRRALGVILAQNTYKCLVAYLAALNAGSAVILLDGSLKEGLRHGFLSAYRPDWIFSENVTDRLQGYKNSAADVSGLFANESPDDLEIDPELALLLTTSGSTGSPKLVRLTLSNLASNAASIAQYLGLTPEERSITSLPISYSYGLSIVNSHLSVGASIVLTDDGILQRGFWDALDQERCTSFAGVPYTYQMLLQTGLLKTKGSTLKTLTQAGGRLDEQYIRQMYEVARSRGWRFFVMYGQTEATARISYVPFERLGEKIGSVGVAIPGGSLSIDGVTSELVYRGPNVMMGYAECRADLAKGDELNGELRTGDVARQDEDGFFYITGRLKRFLKMFGKRFNLDDAERVLMHRCEAVVACYGRDDLLMAAVEDSHDPESIHAIICETFDLPKPAVKVMAISELPRTPNGKLEYKRLPDLSREFVVGAKG